MCFLGDAEEFSPIILSQLDVKMLPLDLQLFGLDHAVHLLGCGVYPDGRDDWKNISASIRHKLFTRNAFCRPLIEKSRPAGSGRHSLTPDGSGVAARKDMRGDQSLSHSLTGHATFSSPRLFHDREVNLTLEKIDTRDMNAQLVANRKTSPGLTADQLALRLIEDVEIVRQG